jgi:hypothetical protein
MSFWWEAGAGGEGGARSARAGLQARDLRGWKIHHHGKGTAFQVRVSLYLFSFLKKEAFARNCLCVQNKKEISVLVTKKPRVGTQNKCLFFVYQSS